MTMQTSRLRSVPREQIDDPELLEILDRAERLSAPKPEWYLATAHHPAASKAFDHMWETVFRAGRVEHKLKELMRLAIVQLLGCDFCSGQRSVLAQEGGLEEEEVLACALPDFDSPDPRLRAALRYARALCTADPSQDRALFDDVYRDLHAVFDEEEVVELVHLAILSIGGTTVARSLDLA